MKKPSIRITLVALLLGLLCLSTAARAQEVAPEAAAQPAEGTAEGAEATAGAAPVDAAAQAAELRRQREAFMAKMAQDYNLPLDEDTGISSEGGIWMPIAASEQAGPTDRLFWFVMWITVIFTTFLALLMVWFAIRYRYREGDSDPVGVPTHSTTLEITWTVIPICLVLVMFVLGFRSFLSTHIAPPSAYRVEVIGSMWNWSFTYPNGRSSQDLHIPEGRPVEFVLQSQDVIHSLFIPAFRMKKDVVPGRFNKIWVMPTRPGIYDVFCTEYCGTDHSAMIAQCFVYPPEEYDEALALVTDIRRDPITGEPRPPVAVGEALWIQRGCRGCHSTDGSVIQAPTWQGLYGSERQFVDGTSAIADENYIRESILYPQRDIVAGWGNAMPSYLGQLTDEDINDLIAFMRSLSDNAKVSADGEVIQPSESQSLAPETETQHEAQP